MQFCLTRNLLDVRETQRKRNIGPDQMTVYEGVGAQYFRLVDDDSQSIGRLSGKVDMLRPDTCNNGLPAVLHRHFLGQC